MLNRVRLLPIQIVDGDWVLACKSPSSLTLEHTRFRWLKKAPSRKFPNGKKRLVQSYIGGLAGLRGGRNGICSGSEAADVTDVIGQH